MFGLSKKTPERIKVLGEDIYIDNNQGNLGKSERLETVIQFSAPIPTIAVYENHKVIRTFHTSDNNDHFRYYNPLRCPHCSATFIDFERYKDMRPNEYYGNTYINEKPLKLEA